MQIKSAARADTKSRTSTTKPERRLIAVGKGSRWLGLVADPGHEAGAFFSETKLKRLPAMPGFC
jgi:hypothetical protein